MIYFSLFNGELYYQKKAFQDALNSKTHYENIKEKLILRQKEEKLELQKYLAGKTTFKSVLKSGSKEDRIKSAENEIAEVIDN